MARRAVGLAGLSVITLLSAITGMLAEMFGEKYEGVITRTGTDWCNLNSVRRTYTKPEDVRGMERGSSVQTEPRHPRSAESYR